jgi:serine-type D-Ala-D-Ala carboxypeptidase
VPVAAVMVSRGEVSLFEGYFGRYLGGDPLAHDSYTIDPEIAPATPQTLFDLASLTKVLATTPLVLQLVDEGRIALDSELGEVLEGLASRTARLTIDELLTHSSGLPALPDLWQGTDPDLPDPDKLHRKLYGIEPVAEPGTQIIYSCTGFIFLGELVRKLRKMDLPAIFDEFSGREQTASFALGYRPPPEKRNLCAPTEWCPWRRRRIAGEVHDENAYALGDAAGNAGLFGTLPAVHAHILSVWGGTLGISDRRARLKPATVRTATAPRKTLSLGASLQDRPVGSPERRGLGFQLAPKQWRRTTGLSSAAFGHTGFTGTSFWADPASGLLITSLTSRLYYGREQSSAGLHAYRAKLFRSALEKYSPP